MSNIKYLVETCIKSFQTTNNLQSFNSGTIFELFSSTILTKNLNLSFDQIQDSLVGGGHDGGIDLFIPLINDEYVSSIDEIDEFKFTNDSVLQVLINQSKGENSFKEGVIDKLLASIPVILNLSIFERELTSRFNSALVEKILIFRKLWERTVLKGGKIIINYSYTSLADDIEINEAYRHKVDQLITLTKHSVNKADVTFENLSCVELLNIYQTQKSNRIKIVFKQQPLSVNFGNSDIGYVGVALLSEYLSFIKDDEGNIREELFESNIRHYQGEVDVNNKIKYTLENDLIRDFWWLNNGITIIATNPMPFGNSLTMDNVQIVNGLQTSYSIAQHYKKIEGENRSVLIKIIINSDKETTDKIIASTNDQNAVSSTLLRATDSIQRSIELYFLSKGYYYDRRKNFYKNQGKSVKRIYSIQFTAQSIEAIINSNPSIARSKPTTLIKEDNTYDKIFDPNRSFEAYLRCCQIMQKTFELFAKQDVMERTLLSNFKLHLARIYASVLTGKATFIDSDLITLDGENLDEDCFNRSINILSGTLSEYSSIHPDEMHSNISKSKAFDSEIVKKLIELL